MATDLFDGNIHEMTPYTDFYPGHAFVGGWEDLDEEDELDPYETPSQAVVWDERKAVYSEKRKEGTEPTERETTDSSWGGVSLALGTLCGILGGRNNSWQNNHYSEDGRVFSHSSYHFQFQAGDTGFQGGRL